MLILVHKKHKSQLSGLVMKKAKTQAIAIDWRKIQRLTFIVFLTAAVYSLFIANAHAGWWDDTFGGSSGDSIFTTFAHALFGNLSPMEEVLCTILLIILGDAGRGIATLAVMGVGIGALYGKATWGQAITVAVGIGIMFGAPIILPLILFDPVGIVGGLVGLNELPSNLNYPCVNISIDGTAEDIGGIANKFK